MFVYHPQLRAIRRQKFAPPPIDPLPEPFKHPIVDEPPKKIKRTIKKSKAFNIEKPMEEELIERKPAKSVVKEVKKVKIDLAPMDMEKVNKKISTLNIDQNKNDFQPNLDN